MRITITTLGTRDDVRPNVALGLGLQAASYTICVATHARFETLTTGLASISLRWPVILV